MNRFYTKAIVASFAALFFATTSLFGQQTSNVKAIDCIPESSIWYLHADLQGLAKFQGIDFFKAMLLEVQPELDELAVEQVGVPASQFKEFTVILPPIEAHDFGSMATDPTKNVLGILTFVDSINPADLVGTLDGNWSIFNANGRKVFSCKERGMCVYHFADNAVIFGTDAWVTWFMHQRAQPKSNQGLSPSFALAGQGQFSGGINGKLLPPNMSEEFGIAEGFDWAGFSIDLSDGVRIKLDSSFDTKSGAEITVKQLEGFKNLAKFQLKGAESIAMRQFRNRDPNHPETAGLGLTQLAVTRYGLKTLKGIKVTQNGNQVVAELHAKEFDLAATAMICLSAVQAIGTSANARFEQISAELDAAGSGGRSDRLLLPKKSPRLEKRSNLMLE